MAIDINIATKLELFNDNWDGWMQQLPDTTRKFVRQKIKQYMKAGSEMDMGVDDRNQLTLLYYKLRKQSYGQTRAHTA